MNGRYWKTTRAEAVVRRPGFRTAAIGRRENRRLWRGRARHRGVSASGTPRHSPKTPRNGGKVAAGSRSGLADLARGPLEQLGEKPGVFGVQ